MTLRVILSTALLAVLWVIFTETLTWQSVFVGLVVGAFVSYFTNKYIPKTPEESTRIKFHKLIVYPFWLIGKMYKDACGLIKLVFTGAKCGIVKEKLELENEGLRTIMASSVTITPGTIALEQTGENITVLCIGEEKASPNFSETVNGLRNIESRLKKAEAKNK
ncbi:MAG: Na+/H+ antiporter subunit E [Defluviitaleaceae bacterium]|nr:Na+/H+ antiporter subunit E [Defluviitaleaceae bacterium]